MSELINRFKQIKMSVHMNMLEKRINEYWKTDVSHCVRVLDVEAMYFNLYKNFRCYVVWSESDNSLDLYLGLHDCIYTKVSVIRRCVLDESNLDGWFAEIDNYFKALM